MKALILKDFISAKRYLKSIGAMLLFFILIEAVGSLQENFISGITMIFSVMVTMNTFSCDRYSKWDSYVNALPISRKDVVFGKYIFGIGIGIMGILIGMIVEYIMSSLSSEAWHMEVYVALFGVLILYLTIMIPMIIKYGLEKSRFFIIAMMILPAAAIYIIAKYTPLFELQITWVCLPIFIFALLIASIWISIRIYTKKEF